METQQLYTPSGEAICPRTNYEADDAAKKISQLQETLAKVVYSVTYELLKNTDISEWALQASKPSYTADEVGADASGSAQSALVSAKEYSDSAYMQATGYTDTKIAELINGAPSTLDTLKEIADAMSQNASVVEALEAAVGSKASDTEAQAHYSNSTVHVTASEKQKIKEVDNKVSKAGDTMSGSLTAPSFIGALKGNSDTSGVAARLSVNRTTKDVNTLPQNGTFIVEEHDASAANLPTQHWYFVQSMNGGDQNFQAQLALGMTSDDAYFRKRYGGVWNAWNKIWARYGTTPNQSDIKNIINFGCDEGLLRTGQGAHYINSGLLIQGTSLENRAAIGFHNPGLNAGTLFLGNDGFLYFINQGGTKYKINMTLVDN